MGALDSGQKLAIDVVAERYAVGTNPVREALNRLSAERLVDRHEQRGFFVPSISIEKWRELVKTRCSGNEALEESILNRSTVWEKASSWHSIACLAFRLPRKESRGQPSGRMGSPTPCFSHGVDCELPICLAAGILRRPDGSGTALYFCFRLLRLPTSKRDRGTPRAHDIVCAEKFRRRLRWWSNITIERSTRSKRRSADSHSLAPRRQEGEFRALPHPIGLSIPSLSGFWTERRDHLPPACDAGGPADPGPRRQRHGCGVGGRNCTCGRRADRQRARLRRLLHPLGR